MKTWYKFALCLSLVLMLYPLSGCGNNKASVASEAPSSTPVESSSPEVTESYPVDLTDTELSDFQKTLNDQSNYGFLYSNYDNVYDADLNQVFYAGAGFNNPDNSAEIIKAYPDAVEDSPCSIITTKQINDFLKIKTGYSLSDMKKPLDWDYIAQYDAYIHYHGDTNYMEIRCTGGRLVGENLYEIEFQISGSIYDSNNVCYTGGIVTVKKVNDEIQFVSNKLIQKS